MGDKKIQAPRKRAGEGEWFLDLTSQHLASHSKNWDQPSPLSTALCKTTGPFLNSSSPDTLSSALEPPTFKNEAGAIRLHHLLSHSLGVAFLSSRDLQSPIAVPARYLQWRRSWHLARQSPQSHPIPAHEVSVVTPSPIPPSSAARIQASARMPLSSPGLPSSREAGFVAVCLSLNNKRQGTLSDTGSGALCSVIHTSCLPALGLNFTPLNSRAS